MKNKNRSWRKYLAGFAIGGLIVSGLALSDGFPLGGAAPLVTDASAGVSGGGSGGGGGSSGTSGGRWLGISKAKLDSGTIRNIPAEYWNSTVCRNAVAYYGVVPNGVSDANVANLRWTFSFHGAAGLNSVSFRNGGTVANAISANMNWTYQQSANYMHSKNFICIDNPNVLTTSEWRYEVRSSSSTDSINENEPHSLTTQVTPQPIKLKETDAAGVLDPIGEKNLNAQASTVLTNYGRVWEEYRLAVDAAGSNSANIVALFKTKFANAKAADKIAARAQVNLNDGNLAGLAEGGVLNISELARRATAQVSTSTSTYQVWRCGYSHYSQSGWQASSANNCGIVTGTIDPNNLPAAPLNSARWLSNAEKAKYTPVSPGQTTWQRFSTVVTPSTETQRQVGFWQIISAHCNPEGIAALKAAMGSDLVAFDSGDTSGNISSLLRTRYYASQPAQVPLGNTHPSLSAAQRATGVLSFYDKECPFECTPSKKTEDGASAANGAINNVANANFQEADKGLWGMSSGNGVNTTRVEFFRDNTEKEIRPDVWYPVSKNGVSYDGSAAKSTLVTRWSEGTPSLGEEFNAYGMVKQPDGSLKKESLFSSSKVQENQRNFDDATPFAASTAGQVRGQLGSIIVQSTWASTNGKPQVLQVAWEYSPSVTIQMPSSIGFAPGGANVTTSGSVSKSTNIDGRCWGNFGTDTQTPAERTLSKTILNANTGTGTTPQFSTPNGNGNNVRNMLINFIRGTGE